MALYQEEDTFFFIVDYLTIVSDREILASSSFDFLILDEAELIRKYENKPSYVINSINRKHTLAISGIILDNKLSDLYSIVSFIDPLLLSPLWEFSYNYYFFDQKSKNKISGYFNLSDLNDRLKRVLISRKRIEIENQLPEASQICYPVEMYSEQIIVHSNLDKKISIVQSRNHGLNEIVAEHALDDEKEDLTDKAFEELLINGFEYISTLYKNQTGFEISKSNRELLVKNDNGEISLKFRLKSDDKN